MENITTNTTQTLQDKNENAAEIKTWTQETDPIKRALKKPLLWYFPSALPNAATT